VSVKNRKKILLVDDSSTSLLMTCMLLSEENYELITARDGVEGFHKAQDEIPDLILLDVVMPNMDGIETCKVLRACKKTEGIPVIMITSRGGVASLEASYASGCNDYVIKPIDSGELLAKVKNCLGEWNAEE
jgi:DNA-binding response OmpR family regulator